jgi:hypothetical protein
LNFSALLLNVTGREILVCSLNILLSEFRHYFVRKLVISRMQFLSP